MVLARGFVNLVDFNKVKVVVRGDKVGVRLKHAEVLAHELPRILWDRLALHGFLRVLFETGHLSHTIDKHSVLRIPDMI